MAAMPLWLRTTLPSWATTASRMLSCISSRSRARSDSRVSLV